MELPLQWLFLPSAPEVGRRKTRRVTLPFSPQEGCTHDHLNPQMTLGALPAQPWHRPYAGLDLSPMSPLAPLLGSILLPTRGLASLDHHDLEEGPSCLCQLSSSGCHGTLVLLQAKAKQPESTWQAAAPVALLPLRAPGSFWRPWRQGLPWR